MVFDTDCLVCQRIFIGSCPRTVIPAILMAGGHGSLMSGDRRADLRYLKQLAAAAETNGFEAVLTPTGLWCEDAWLTTAALIDATETLKFLVAFRPGLTSPTLAAQMAASFQWHSQEGFTSMS